MPLWMLVFFPPKGERNSPVDFLETYCTKKELASILAKLTSLQERQVINWPYDWAKPVRGFKQMTSGDFRIYHQLRNGTIFVIHACRKVQNKATEKDIRTASSNWENLIRGGK